MDGEQIIRSPVPRHWGHGEMLAIYRAEAVRGDSNETETQSVRSDTQGVWSPLESWKRNSSNEICRAETESWKKLPSFPPSPPLVSLCQKSEVKGVQF
jgi:hypothetical protein